MRRVFSVLLCLFILGCVPLTKQLATSVRGMDNKEALVIYTFAKYHHPWPALEGIGRDTQPAHNLYCEVKAEIIFRNGLSLPFLDDYEWHFHIRKTLPETPVLAKKLDRLLIPEEKFDLPWYWPGREKLYPTWRLGDSPHKFVSGNIDGYRVIESNAVFDRPDESNLIYIVFNVQGDFIYYHEANEFSASCARYVKIDFICDPPLQFSRDNLIIIRSVKSTSLLTEKQRLSMGLEKSKIGVIKTPVEE